MKLVQKFLRHLLTMFVRGDVPGKLACPLCLSPDCLADTHVFESKHPAVRDFCAKSLKLDSVPFSTCPGLWIRHFRKLHQGGIPHEMTEPRPFQKVVVAGENLRGSIHHVECIGSDVDLRLGVCSKCWSLIEPSSTDSFKKRVARCLRNLHPHLAIPEDEQDMDETLGLFNENRYSHMSREQLAVHVKDMASKIAHLQSSLRRALHKVARLQSLLPFLDKRLFRTAFLSFSQVLRRLDSMSDEDAEVHKCFVILVDTWATNVMRKSNGHRFPDVIRQLAFYLYSKSPSAFRFLYSQLRSAFPSESALKYMRRHDVSQSIFFGKPLTLSMHPGNIKYSTNDGSRRALVAVSGDGTACQKNLEFDRRTGLVVGAVMPAKFDEWTPFVDATNFDKMTQIILSQAASHQSASLDALFNKVELADHLYQFLCLFPSSGETKPLLTWLTNNSYTGETIADQWDNLSSELHSGGAAHFCFISDLDGKERKAGMHLGCPHFILKENCIPLGLNAPWYFSFCRIRPRSKWKTRVDAMPVIWLYDADHFVRLARSHCVGDNSGLPSLGFSQGEGISISFLGTIENLKGFINPGDLRTPDSQQYGQRSDSAMRIFSLRSCLELKALFDSPPSAELQSEIGGTLLFSVMVSTLLESFLYSGPVSFKWLAFLGGVGISILRLWSVASDQSLCGLQGKTGPEMSIRVGCESIFHGILNTSLAVSYALQHGIIDVKESSEFVMRRLQQLQIEGLWSACRGFGVKPDARINFSAAEFGRCCPLIMQLADMRINPENYGFVGNIAGKNKAAHIKVRHDQKVFVQRASSILDILTERSSDPPRLF
eukprot:ANDGO_07246.mRNA.1 hypothetical protein